MLFLPLLAQQRYPSPFFIQENPFHWWIAPAWQHWVLFASILLLILSFYLFFQSISLQEFAFRGIEGAPPATSGMAIVILIVPVVILYLCSLGTIERMISDPASQADVVRHNPGKNWVEASQFAFIFYVQHYPLTIVPALALGGLLPSALAIYKFLIAITFLKTRGDIAAPASVGRALIGIWIGAINFLASIVTLISFWRMSR